MAVSAARPLATTATSRRPPLWLFLGLGLALLTLLPYVFGHLAQPPGRTFMGFFFLGDDANTYLAKMREGLDGAWVWTNKYTTEPSTPIFFGQQTDTLDWRMPELTAFYSILALPHFAWAAAFQALAAVLTLRAAERGSLKLGFLAGLAWLGEASIHAQMPILVGGAIV